MQSALLIRGRDNRGFLDIEVREQFTRGGKPWRARVTVESLPKNAVAQRSDGLIHTLVVAGKVHNVVETLLQQRARIGPHTTLVILRNALALHRAMQKEPRLRSIGTVLLGSCKTPIATSVAYTGDRHGLGHFIQKDFGTFLLGLPPADAEESPTMPEPDADNNADGGVVDKAYRVHQRRSLTNLAAMLMRAGMSVRLVDDMRPDLWRGLCVRICLHHTTAVEGLDITDVRKAWGRVEALAKEITNVARAYGVDITLEEALDTVAQASQSNKMDVSPQLLDLQKGRVSDIQYTCGYVMELAEPKGIATPEHKRLADELTAKAMEALRARREEEAAPPTPSAPALTLRFHRSAMRF